MTKSSIRREICIALAIKLVLLAVLYEAFFATPLAPRLDPEMTARALLGAPLVSTPSHP